MKTKINLLKKGIFIALLTSFIGMGSASAQLGDDYKHAIGARLGSPIGFTYKHFFTNNHAIEAQVGYAFGWGGLGYGGYGYGYPYGYGYGAGWGAWGGIDIAALYEYHRNIVGGLNWFAGGGGVVQIFPQIPTVIGGPAIIGGVTYKFDFPLELSADYRPSVLFGSGGYAGHRGFATGAVSARYTF